MRWSLRGGLALLMTIGGAMAQDGPQAVPATAGVLVWDEVERLPPVMQARLDRYSHSRAARLLGWTHDGALLIATRFSESEQVHRVERPLGARRQLTFLPRSVTGAHPAPPALGGFAYLLDDAGDENYRLYLQRYDRVEAARVAGEHRRLIDPVWSRSGRFLVFSSAQRHGRGVELWIQKLAANEASRLLLAGQLGNWSALDWSPSDDRLLVRRWLSAADSRLYVLDVASGALTAIDPGESDSNAVSVGSAKFAADGAQVYFTSTRGSQFRHLRLHDLRTRRTIPISGDIPWDVTALDVAKRTGHVAFVVNAGGRGELYLLEPGAQRYRAAPVLPVPGAQISAISFDAQGRRLAVGSSGANAPADVHVLDLRKRRYERWTHSESGPVDPRQWASARTFSYATFDSVDGEPRRIPAVRMQPPGAGPHPVLIQIHGGPEAQAVADFNPLHQFLVAELGIAVVQPNVRGSSGYGKTFLALDDGRRREDAVRDVGALLDWIASEPTLDERRVVVYGGSYGGYVALAALGHYSQRLAGGISAFGISHFVTFLESLPEGRRAARRAEYGDERDPAMRAFFDAISPLTFARRITRPVLIIQGANDPRVPASESRQMVAAIREQGGRAGYLLATEEGHGFTRRENREAQMSAMVAFLLQLWPALAHGAE